MGASVRLILQLLNLAMSFLIEIKFMLISFIRVKDWDPALRSTYVSQGLPPLLFCSRRKHMLPCSKDNATVSLT